MLKKSILLLSLPVLAVAGPKSLLLSQVSYQPSAEAWVQTNSADVQVGVDATLSQGGVAARKQHILSRLQSVVPGQKWHVVSFNQSKDSSGLTRLSIQANARVAQAATTDLANKLKKISKNGEQYRVLSMQFSPSLAQMEQGRQQLRQRIYQQVVTEIKSLNQTYRVKYFPKAIDFSPVSAMPTRYVAMNAMVGSSRSASPQAKPALASRLVLKANVVLAAQSNAKSS